jgi:hypothetical protein
LTCALAAALTGNYGERETLARVRANPESERKKETQNLPVLTSCLHGRVNSTGAQPDRKTKVPVAVYSRPRQGVLDRRNRPHNIPETMSEAAAEALGPTVLSLYEVP